MAICEQPLTEAMILGLRGQVDFYYWKGKVIARRWPRKRTSPPHPKEKEGQDFFGRVNHQIKQMSAPNRDQWRAWVEGSTIVWTDAIRFFNCSDNPEHILPPPFYHTNTASICYPQFADYRVRLFYIADMPTTELESVALGSWFDRMPPSTDWEFVRQKRRRRAILDAMFRPAKSGFLMTRPIHFIEADEVFFSEMISEYPKPFLLHTTAPTQLPYADRAQTPHKIEAIQWNPQLQSQQNQSGLLPGLPGGWLPEPELILEDNRFIVRQKFTFQDSTNCGGANFNRQKGAFAFPLDLPYESWINTKVSGMVGTQSASKDRSQIRIHGETFVSIESESLGKGCKMTPKESRLEYAAQNGPHWIECLADTIDGEYHRDMIHEFEIEIKFPRPVPYPPLPPMPG